MLRPWGLPEEPQEVKQVRLWEPGPTSSSVGPPRSVLCLVQFHLRGRDKDSLLTKIKSLKATHAANPALAGGYRGSFLSHVLLVAGCVTLENHFTPLGFIVCPAKRVAWVMAHILSSALK